MEPRPKATARVANVHSPFRAMYLTTTPGIKYSTLMPFLKNIRTLVDLRNRKAKGGNQPT